ncbi:uncharacterized protein LOC128556686 [Mercenaria mercenaria]|uniref:uncharacterized protein LOC128556686 n=1 Tax=Mercenaria mercenaria TaxID=6596 RepID=UPI00234EBE59|nr:uncharacterized protein LOC128556686 [Mercenaria mercenaria]
MEINFLEKRMGSKTSECHRIWQKLVPLLLLGCFCFVVDGQIGITSCTVDTAANCPNYLPNSYCNVGTLLCECPAGYVANAANIGCEYECGALAAPGNGAVDTSAGTAAGDIATFSCDSAYKLSGSAISTCVDSTGWDNTATRCVPVCILVTSRDSSRGIVISWDWKMI